MNLLVAGLLGLTFLILLGLALWTYAHGAETVGHRAEQFDGILAGRYAFMAFAFGCALLAGLPWLILAMLGAFGVLAFWDAYVYAQATQETDLHIYAGILSLAVFVIYGLSVVFRNP